MVSAYQRTKKSFDSYSTDKLDFYYSGLTQGNDLLLGQGVVSCITCLRDIGRISADSSEAESKAISRQLGEFYLSYSLPIRYNPFNGLVLDRGSFARLMTRNEVIWKTKLLMQQSLSHGAPSPKLLKMTEILVDHFKKNDPNNSRVIIFSNFRGSVRDIMNTLSSIGDSVKATEFIGQSSGKILKGQTQKIQQAVLQKFRTGGYNIIVATSIGEEGLDIMEVDLVICFDANISPLRMIQRMGRTGRKHDGRVVVLACEGSEIKGYMRKQANSKAVRKHMRNGGMNSFDFHSSPRMIPHICKPDVHFVEFSVTKFVHHRYKAKDELVNDQSFREKLSNDEADLIAKYFPSSSENTWKPSLIAFPHFQSFPSSVYDIMHSFRTRMLIDTMQHIQALSFPVDSKAVPLKVWDNSSSHECMEAKDLTPDTTSEKDFVNFHDIPGPQSEEKATVVEALGTVISSCTEMRNMSDSYNTNHTMHCFLFEAVYVSVKPSGAVSIASVPSFPFVKEVPLCKSKSENNTEQLNTVKHNYSTSNCELEGDLTNPAESSGIYNHFMSSSQISNPNAHAKPVADEVENIPSTPSPKKSYMDSEVLIVETPVSTIRNVPVVLANKSTNDIKDVDMSPRLTNMIEEGVVPESPLGEIGDHYSNVSTVHRGSSSEHVNDCLVPKCSREGHMNNISKDSVLQSKGLPFCELRRQLLSPVNVPFGFNSSLSLIDLNSKKFENNKECKNVGALGDVCGSPINIDIHTPLVKMHSCSNAREGVCDSPNNMETRTPLVNLTNSCSNDWHLSSGSKSIQHSPKFKRLRKYRDSSNNIKKGLIGPISNVIEFTTKSNPEKQIKSKRNMVSDAKVFIDEEAEVSSDAQVSSDDEEEDDNNNSTDDSFIDDRTNPTMESTQAEAIRSDMMAIYRRSLLSQSPMSPLCRAADLHTSSVKRTIETDESGSCSSGKIRQSLQTPQTGVPSANQSAVRSSNLCLMNLVGDPHVNMQSESSVAPKEEKKIENRKRKLSFHQIGYDPETSLQPQRLFHLGSTGNTSLQCQPESIKLNEDAFSDDQFYEGLDLDALEAQATTLLKNKSDLLLDRRKSVVSDHLPNKAPELSDSPSFDLGI